MIRVTSSHLPIVGGSTAGNLSSGQSSSEMMAYSEDETFAASLSLPQPKRSRLSLRRTTTLLHKPCYDEDDKLPTLGPKGSGLLNVEEVDLTQDENASPNCNMAEIQSLLSTFVWDSDVTVWTLGLPNCGNTCYVNSILQVLRYSPNFLTSLHLLLATQNQIPKISSAENEAKELMFFQQLHMLYTAMKRKEVLKKVNVDKDYCIYLQKPVQSVISSLREISTLFEEGEQHDAHELLITIISSFSTAHQVLKNQFPKQEDDISPPISVDSPMESTSTLSPEAKLDTPCDLPPAGQEAKRKSVVGRRRKNVRTNFDFSSVEELNLGLEGKIRHVVKCLECERRLEREESFANLEVNIPEVDSDEGELDTVDLRRCLSQTTTLSGENKFYCEVCLRHNEARMSSEVIALPHVLLLHFSWLRSSSEITNIEKTSIKVIIPLTLKTSENKDVFHVSHEEDYKLYAVVLHIGKSTDGGHYVAFIKDAYQNVEPTSNERPKNPKLTTKSPESCCVTEEITHFKDIETSTKWLLFDDNVVLPVHIDEDSESFPYFNYLSVTASPSMIFYHKT